ITSSLTKEQFFTDEDSQDSESARGEGGRLFTFRDGERWYVKEWYPELGNLMPRDNLPRHLQSLS
ncbi:MAG: hypothetical protein MJ014_09000, partial [Methanocorpusculum sp.]|nr:hypothetical protein [Methanocorpusculum sp.]